MEQNRELAKAAGAELVRHELVSLQDVVRAFLQRQNENTRKAYEKELRRLTEWLEVEGFGDTARVLFTNGAGHANKLVLTWRNELEERGMASSTINRSMAAIRSMSKIARLLGLINWEVEVGNVQSSAYKDTAGPGVDAYKAIVKVLDEDSGSPRGARNKAMIFLLFERALRRFEVVGLDLADVDSKRCRVRVLGKGRREYEWHTVSRQTMDAIRSWILLRGDEPGPLFSSLDPAGKGDGRLSKSSLNRVVTEVGNKAGVKAWPHGLRHTAITAALDATKGDVRRVMKFSRHKRLDTLMIYDDNRQDHGGEISQLLADQVDSGDD